MNVGVQYFKQAHTNNWGYAIKELRRLIEETIRSEKTRLGPRHYVLCAELMSHMDYQYDTQFRVTVEEETTGLYCDLIEDGEICVGQCGSDSKFYSCDLSVPVTTHHLVRNGKRIYTEKLLEILDEEIKRMTDENGRYVSRETNGGSLMGRPR